MSHQNVRSFSGVMVGLVLAIVLQGRVIAGPPLICHPFEIGDARSLPWNGKEWRSVKADYDLTRLVEDTLALLKTDTPILARMETMRRATIYAVWAKNDREVGYAVKDQKIAEELLTRLMDRVRQSIQSGKPDALALFDAGYLAASYRHAGYRSTAKPNSELDGTGMMAKAATIRGGNAEMEFAMALATHRSATDVASHRAHLQKAIDGAKEGSLLAKNLLSHFGRQGQQLADLRAQVAVTK